MDKIKRFFIEVSLELRRVSWPKRSELWASTWIVIFVSLLLSVIIGAIDLIYSHIVRAILR